MLGPVYILIAEDLATDQQMHYSQHLLQGEGKNILSGVAYKQGSEGNTLMIFATVEECLMQESRKPLDSKRLSVVRVSQEVQ